MRDEVDGFSAFYLTQYSSIVRAAYLVSGDQHVAEEAAQEAFVRAYTRWRRISRYERPGAWARLVALRLAVRAVDQRARRLETEGAVSPGADGLRVDIVRALTRLPPQQRLVIVLTAFAGEPIDEVAKALGCAESTARVHLHRARKTIAELTAEVMDNDS